ncbi:MauE/DoxX family redox-associated membrane protein [Kribbella sp. NPDC058245]|uniref:MauE/DoxX family redox-associated membrane protein n=1 Tax=Kribbella sp. NPDC058245 TaxID=3346399 RepID=UPI0036F0D5E0
MADFIEVAARAFLALVFVTAFTGKALTKNGFRGFAQSVQGLARLKSARAAAILAGIVVGGEGLAAALLVSPIAPRLGFVVGGLMLLLFTGVVIRSVRAGIFAECRCFGGRGAIMSAAMVGRNLVFLVVAVAGAVVPAVPLLQNLQLVLPAVALGLLLAFLVIRYYNDFVRLLLRRHSTV